jgi:hypothetical protein
MQQKEGGDSIALDKLVEITAASEVAEVSLDQQARLLDLASAAYSREVDLFQLRRLLSELLRSSGGRPALEGVHSQVKIPKIDTDWIILKQLTLACGDLYFRPSITQVAAVLLHLSLKDFAEERLSRAIRQELA